MKIIYRNQKLFSDHYLKEKLPQSQEWKETEEEKFSYVFKEIKVLYEKEKVVIPSLKESQLEERWIRPVLRKLGHIYEANPSLPKMREGTKEPDYAFYSSKELSDKGIKYAVAIGEAKRYDRPLDKELKVDPEDTQNPSLQISRYLWLSEISWGILTDGKLWRLYERETSKRLDIFYEIDLFRLLEEGSLEEFKYFYCFFRQKAFPDFLKKVYNESLDYAEAVGEELKDNVYHALKILAEGFLSVPDNKLNTNNLKEIHDNW